LSLPREKLVADWQARLAAAGETSAEPPSRAAWLARLRLRLYRFLLSLYGEGEWNAAQETDTERRAASPGIPDIETPLAGKPAKDASTIRAAIRKVAQAQDSWIAAGPLVHGIDRDQWVVVATRASGIDPQLAAAALAAKGMPARIEPYGRDFAVKVQVQHGMAASEFVLAHRSELIFRPRPVRPARNQRETPLPNRQLVFLLFGLAAGPLLGVAGIGAIELLWPHTLNAPPWQLGLEFFGFWLASSLLYILAYWLENVCFTRRRRAGPQETKVGTPRST
jgi:hypothetical protein